jgi:hypothetical protein
MRFIFPSVASVVDWVTLSANYNSICPVTIENIPLVGRTNHTNADIRSNADIRVDSEKELQTFLRVLLVQFSRYGGLQVDRLCSSFRDLLDSHTLESREPFSDESACNKQLVPFHPRRLRLRKGEDI